MAENKGKITQIIGAVLDVRFEEGHLPEINEAIRIPLADGGKLVVEVAQHLGDDTVRCIAMGSTDGLVRGMDGDSNRRSHLGPRRRKHPRKDIQRPRRAHRQ